MSTSSPSSLATTTTTTSTPMSTTLTPTSTSDAPFFSVGPATTSVSNSGGSGTSTSLYLFTFLATLLLLLSISCAIVLRSFVRRRRFRRDVAAAIASGALPPGSRPVPLGEKPRLWDAAVVPARGPQWGDIIPVAVQASYPGQLSSNDALATLPKRTKFARLAARLLPRMSSSLSSPSSPLLPSMPPDPHTGHMQVSVLVAMPCRHVAASNSSIRSLKGKERSLHTFWDEEEGSVPDVVLGMTSVPYKSAS